MLSKTLGVATSFSVLCAAAAGAHHSHAMFDGTSTIALAGTVIAFEWTNPHSWVQLAVTDENGAAVEWALEMGSPAQLYRAGWRPGTLAAGDAVSAILHPLKDGNAGGALMTITLPDGKEMSAEND